MSLQTIGDLEVARIHLDEMVGDGFVEGGEETVLGGGISGVGICISGIKALEASKGQRVQAEAEGGEGKSRDHRDETHGEEE